MVKKIVFIIVVMGLAVFPISSYAMMGCSMHDKSAHAEEAGAAKEGAIVNKACPITGEAVDKNITYSYKGKLYGFCCQACIEEFKKNPEKYMNEMESQSESAASEGMHEGHEH